MGTSSSANLIKLHPFHWITLAGGLICFSYLIFAFLVTIQYGAIQIDKGWSYSFKSGKPFINKVAATGPAFGQLQVGDQIIAINDDDRISKLEILGLLELKLRTIEGNAPYKLTVLRDGNIRQFELSHHINQDFNRLLLIAPYLILGLSLYCLAIVVGLLKPQQRITQLLCLMCFVATCYVIRLGLAPTFGLIPATGYRIITFFSIFIHPLLAPLLFDYCQRLPDGKVNRSIWVLLKYFLYLSAFILILCGIYKNGIIVWQGEEQALTFYTQLNYPWIASSYWPFFLVNIANGILFSSIVIIFNYRKEQELTRRRKLKWLIYGIVVGLFPSLVTLLINIALIKSKYSASLNTTTYLLVEAFATLCIALCPIATGYAIIKYRHFDINFVIRRGVQYLLAKSVLYILLALQVCLIGLTLIRNPNLTIAEIFSPYSAYIYLISVTTFSLAYRTAVIKWIDKQFFRDLYNREQILIELIDKIKELDSIKEIFSLVIAQVELALHPKAIYILSSLQSNSSSADFQQFAPDCAKEVADSLFQLMNNKVTTEEIASLENSLANSIDKSSDWVVENNIKLIVPIKRRVPQPLALILLTGKRSEEPYSANDKRLLEAIAGQIGVVYEGVLLKASIDKELRIKQAVLDKLEAQQFNLLKECPICNNCYDASAEICSIDNSKLILTLPVERTIDDKYRLDRQLGKGGMGAVYQAMDLRLNRKVAVKLMLGNRFGNQEAIRRFEREAQASAKLSHTNIITLYDFGRLNTEGAFLVMELLPGESLREKFTKMKLVPAPIVANWFEQLLAGINAAHQNGVIHRDLKPENILIVEQPDGSEIVKILDFGLAKINHSDLSELSQLTEPGAIMGTLGYMSYEQLAGDIVDERGDIFAIGVMVVEALTGKRPFKGKNIGELILSMMKDSFHLENNSPESQRLDDILQRCLVRDRNARFASVAELQRELIPAMRAYSLVETEKNNRAQSATLLPVATKSADMDAASLNWLRVKEVLAQVLEKPPAERAGFLIEICAGDISLQKEVEEYLNYNSDQSEFLESPLIKAGDVIDKIEG